MNVLKVAKWYFNYKVKDKFADRNGDLPSHTVEHNRSIWNERDWSEMGEEWGSKQGKDVNLWKQELTDSLMMPYLKGHVLEIGPGAGKWTAYMKDRAARVILADIAPKCLDICRERFKENSNIDYHLLHDDLSLDFIPDASIDFIWSYDVFVHINPSDIRHYLQQFARILKPGAVGVIHHSGTYDDQKEAIKGFRAYMTAELFTEMAEGAGMKVIKQDTALPHKKGDIISVFQR